MVSISHRQHRQRSEPCVELLLLCSGELQRSLGRIDDDPMKSARIWILGVAAPRMEFLKTPEKRSLHHL